MKVKYLVMLTVLTLSGCHKGSVKPSKSSHFYTAQSLIVRGCGTDITLTNMVNPVTLYSKMVNCINSGNYKNSIILFALAGTYSYFDVSRSANTLMRELHTSLLADAMKGIDAARKKIFWEKLQRSLSSQAELAALCSQIRQVGMPKYSVNYRDNISSSTFDDLASANHANHKNNWEAALQNYLYCPVLSSNASATIQHSRKANTTLIRSSQAVKPPPKAELVCVPEKNSPNKRGSNTSNNSKEINNSSSHSTPLPTFAPPAIKERTVDKGQIVMNIGATSAKDAAAKAMVEQVWRAEIGSTLKDTLALWVAKNPCTTGPKGNNWTLIWLTEVNYRLDAPLHFTGDFRKALNEIFKLYGNAAVPIYAGISTQQCVVKVDDKREP